MDRYTEVIGFNGDIAREFLKQFTTTPAEDRQVLVAALDAGDEQVACADSTDMVVEYGGEVHHALGLYVVVLNEQLSYVTVYRDEEAMQKTMVP